MGIESPDFLEQIAATGEKALTESSRGLAYTAKEQGGVEVTAENSLQFIPEMQDRVTDMLGLAELTAELRQALFERTQRGEVTDFSKHDPEQRAVVHQEHFMTVLLGENPHLLDKLAMVEAKAQILGQVLAETPDDPAAANLQEMSAAWKKTIEEIAGGLSGSPEITEAYRQLVAANMEKLSSAPSEAENQSDSLEVPAKRSYQDRLAQLIQKPRAVQLITSKIGVQQAENLANSLIDQYLETAFTLNTVRVLDRIERPIDVRAQRRKLSSVLEGREYDPVYEKVIEVSGLKAIHSRVLDSINQIIHSSQGSAEKKQKIQELHNQLEGICDAVMENFALGQTEETVDVVGTREAIGQLQDRAAQIRASEELSEIDKKAQLSEIDTQVQALLVPIANKVSRVFPHEDSTNLADVLENEEAICAGKVNILLATATYLGINARANGVSKHFNKSASPHVCFEGDLPSGNKIVIDANFGVPRYLAHKTKEELAAKLRADNPRMTESELSAALGDNLHYAENVRALPEDCHVLMYTAGPTGEVSRSKQQSDQVDNQPYQFIRVDPYTGRHEIWQASVPYPHLMTSPDKDGYMFINSSFSYNTALVTNRSFKDVGVYLFKKQIEACPYKTEPYVELAHNLNWPMGAEFLDQTRRSKPELYWNSISVEHALLWADYGDLSQARRIFEDIKRHNPEVYYAHLYLLVDCYRREARGSEEWAEGFNESAVHILEEARQENPGLFYANGTNVSALTRYYEEQPDKVIGIYEEFQARQEELFWQKPEYGEPCQVLANLYFKAAESDPQRLSQAIEFAYQILERRPELYVKNISRYVATLIDGPTKDLPQAARLLEAAKQASPELFFSDLGDIQRLLDVYKQSHNIDSAKALCEEVKVFNPDNFWNDEFGSIYPELIKLYQAAGDVDAVIALYEEARRNSIIFWKNTYRGGYSDLIKVYVEAGRMDEALAISLEGQSNDKMFFAPAGSTGGYLQLAELYQRRGESQAALATLWKGKDVDPSFWFSGHVAPHVFQLVELCEKNQWWTEAISALEQVRHYNPEYWKTDYYKVCRLYDLVGDHDKARIIRHGLISDLEDLKGHDRLAYYKSAGRLSRLYEDEGQPEKAIQILEDGKANYSYMPITDIFHLAELYMQHDQKDRAAEVFKEFARQARNFSPKMMAYVIKKARSFGIEISVPD